MTLCLAALAWPERKIVVAADLMLSLSDLSMSAETDTTKGEPISPSGRWLGLFAGDPSVWAEVLEVTTQRLREGEDRTVWQVIEAVEAGFRHALQRRIESEILSPYDLTREEFLDRGREQFGEQLFDQLAYRIGGVSLDTQVLIAGFEERGHPRIAMVTERGTTHCERLGFHAIGSGAPLALGSLYARYGQTLHLDEVIYRVCEAKFTGERALGVGKQTMVMVMKSDATFEWIHPSRMGPIRAFWEANGNPPVPEEARKIVREQRSEMAWRWRAGGFFVPERFGMPPGCHGRGGAANGG